MFHVTFKGVIMLNVPLQSTVWQGQVTAGDDYKHDLARNIREDNWREIETVVTEGGIWQHWQKLLLSLGRGQESQGVRMWYCVTMGSG